MSLQDKLIIPLCDDRIDKQYLTEKAGLLGIYTKDLNSPECDNHIILEYGFNLHTMLEVKRVEHFKSLGYHPKKMKINGRWVLVYYLPYKDKAAFYYKQTGNFLKVSNVLRKIIKFWTIEDDDVAEYALNNDPKYLLKVKFKESILPEEDYEDVEYKGMLVVQKNPQGVE